MTTGIGLALFAAMLFAVSAALQHHVARSTALRRYRSEGGRPARWLPVLGLLWSLVRNPIWLLGALVTTAGFLAHAAALGFGAIGVVQAVLVMQLLFALPLATVRRRRLPLLRDWVGTVAVCGGLIGLLAVRGVIPQTTEHRDRAFVVVSVAAVVVVLLVMAARFARRHAHRRTAFMGVAAGICFCMTATFLVFLTADLSAHGLAGLVDWPLLGIAATTTVGSVLVQDAFAGDSLPMALTATTITDPTASWIVGLLLFDVKPPAGVGTVVGCLLSGAAVAIGIGLLANSPTLRDRTSDYLRTSPPPEEVPEAAVVSSSA
jgi:hypothetical protein